MKAGVAIGRTLKRVGPKIVWPFSFLLKIFGRYFLLPLYKAQLYFKRKILSIYSPARSKVFLLLTKKYIVHFLIVSLTMFVFVGNINAQETRAENFGHDTIMYSLFNAVSDYEVVEELAVYQPQEKILSYLDKSSQVENNKVIADVGQVTEEQLATGLSAVTTGGTAVLRPNITETDIVTAERTKVQEHTVQDGETVSTIAQQYGISTNTVLWANNLSANSLIKPGATLKILPVTGLEHEVVKNDTVKSLAQKYEVDEEKIIEYNRLPEDGTITLGKTLIIPGGIRAPIAPPKQTYVTGPTVSPISNIFRPPNKEVTAGGMTWPTTWRTITQYYGWRHTGLDIDGDYNSPIYAAEAGKITFLGWKNGYGNCVIIDHGGGVVTLYAHLNSFLSKNGQYVEKGQTIGMMGTTGRSTGTHLHFEVRINGSFRNPLQYIH